MNSRRFNFFCRAGLLAALCAVCAATTARGATRDFVLGGVSFTLEDVTPDTAVYFTSMRLNRAVNAWNVEASVSNRSARVFSGPLVLLVESATGTSGLLQPDGVSSNQAFVDLSGQLDEGVLSPANVTVKRTLVLGFVAGTPAITTRVYALAPPVGGAVAAFLRSLNEVGQPLGGVQVDESGPAGQQTQRTDPSFGVATVGRGAGEHLWKFSLPDYLPVWRQQSLGTNGVGLVVHPRLTRRNPNATTLTPIGGGVVSNETVAITFAPGAVNSNQLATLTPLTQQTLPALLPLGWSPLQAFWIEVPGQISFPPNATLRPWGPFNANEAGALVQWNGQALRWDVRQLLTSTGTNPITATLPGAGAFALVVADAVPNAPPAPQAGQPLPAATTPLPNSANLTAAGTVVPSSSPASLVPELVTGTATLLISNRAGVLPSGFVLPCDVSEEYRLQSGARLVSPEYDNFIVGYHRPGDALANTLHATFPIRPLRLFAADVLEEAVVRVDVQPPGAFAGTLLTTNGGLIASGGVRLLAGPGDLTGSQAALLRSVSPTNFTDLAGGLSVLQAFDLNVSGVVPGQQLTLLVTNAPANGLFVIARVLQGQGLYGMEPVERLASDGQGRLTSLETNTTDRLPGIASSGQYLLLQVTQPQALLKGVARNSLGQPAGGLLIRLAPWTTLSRTPDGQFLLTAPAGTNQLAVTDLNTGDTGQSALPITPGQTLANPFLTTTLAGPRVVFINPTNGAVAVSRVTPIVVTFSERVNPATLLNGGLLLLGTNGTPVPASLSLNLQNTTATLLPTDPVAPAALFTIRLSTNVSDLAGAPIEGPTQFTFTTVSAALNRANAQFVIYEPTNGVAPVFGTPGTADPESPVIIVNETSGQTATVLSKPDGSFTNSIPADVDDFISAVLVNQNGTRTTLPASRQVFRDGSVGLFGGGGVVETPTPSGAIQFTVQPGTVQGKARFKIEPLSLSDLPALTSNTPPANAKTVAAMKFKMSGDRADGPSDISLPFDPATLPLNAGVKLEDMGFVLAIVRTDGGQTAYQVVDRLKFKDGKLTSNTFPFLGLLNFIGSAIIGATFEEALEFTIVAVVIGADPVPVAGSVLEEVALNPGQPTPNVVQRALPGAFVYAQFVGQSIGLPGRLPAGIVYATADKDGKYALSLPLEAGSAAVPFTKATDYLLFGTHPKYSQPQVEPLPLRDFGIGFGRDVIFERKLVFPLGARQNAILVPPSVNISHTPVFPSTNTPVSLQVNASHPNALPVIEPSVRRVITSAGEGTPQDVKLTVTDQTVLGPNQLRWRATLAATNRVRVVLQIVARVNASDGTASASTNFHIVDFGEIPDLGQNPLPVADKSDTVGPSVVLSDPPPSGTLAPGTKIRLTFNEPIATSVLSNASAITCAPQGTGLLGTDGGVPTLVLSADQSVLSLFFPKLEPGKSYRLTLPTTIQDLSANALDQSPGESENQEYTLEFDTAPQVQMNLPDLVSGGGVVGRDNFLFALERSGEGALVVYDVSKPSQPRKAATAIVPGIPRDLVLIPHYSFVFHRGEPPVTRDLLAVVGGDLGMTGIDENNNVFFRGQYLRIFDVTDPANPVRLISATVSRSPDAVTKVRWSPPLISYFENGSDLQQVVLVDLQEMIVGFSASQTEAAAFPLFGVNGIDADGNGDYVGTNDRVPLPPKEPAGFFGRKRSFILQDTDQRILDYDFDARRFYLGVTLGSGRRLAAGLPVGNVLPPSYRTVVAEDQPLTAALASVPFGLNSRPKRVFSLVVPNLEVSGTNTSLTVALVSLAPDNQGSNTLAVIDITLPESPTLLRTLSLPDGLGLPQSISLRPDGLIAWATTTSLVLLDPSKLARPAPADGSSHAAIVSILPNAGSGNISLASGSAVGIQGVNLGDRHAVIQVPPQLDFVSVLGQTTLVNPSALVDQTNEIATQLGLNLENVRVETQLEPARVHTAGGSTNSLKPALPAAHYYVLVHAPGGDVGSGTTMELSLESLNRAGHPLKNKGDEFPPVRAMSDVAAQAIGQAARSCDAPIKPLTAYRLSSNPSSPFYNLYLSKPIALIYERISSQELADLRASPDREILWSGYYLRAFIDKSEEGGAAIGSFAAGVDNGAKLMKPRAVVTAETFPATYVMGDNPAPVNGGVSVPGTFGMVSANNGQFQAETVDIALPSRRMPIVFERTICGQDLFEGPFGRGWDFNYNQHLVELRPGIFSSQSRMPQVIRQTDNSEIADQRDVLFVNGAGRIVLFKFVSSSAPPECIGDPLIGPNELDWKNKANSFYLPKTPGVFDLLVRFPDGQLARLTPDGTQYWYSSHGRLEKIYDRHPKNQQVLTYNERDELIRITDKSVTTDRYLDIGYWRLGGDALLRSDLDMVTDNVFVAGKICQLKDYSGRAVQFNYTEDAILKERLGVKCDGANGGFADRPKTTYIAGDTCAKNIKGVNSGASQSQGTAVFAAAVDDQKKTVSGGGGAAGPITFTPPAQNTAAAADNSTTKASGPDGAKSDFTFDKLGYPKTIGFSGQTGAPAVTTPVYNDLGLLEKVTHPEGNFVVYTYDTNNANLRSRANLTKEERFPGPRTGTPSQLTAKHHYEERYNLQSDDQSDFNGNTITYTLSTDGREIESINYVGAGKQEFHHNEYGQVTFSKTPGGVQTDTFYYDDNGFTREELRGGAMSFKYSYDQGTRPGKLGAPTSIQPPTHAGLTLSYDDRLLPTSITRDQYNEKRGYDENGNVTFISRSLGDGQTYEEHRQFNQINFLEKVVLKNVAADGQNVELETKYFNDSAWRVGSVKLPGGEERKFTYDHLGHLIHMEIGDAAYFEDYVLDRHGNLRDLKKKGTTVSHTDYDGYDRPIAVKRQGNRGEEKVEMTYFGNGEVKSTVVTDPADNVIFDEESDDPGGVDALGRPKKKKRIGTVVDAPVTYSYPASSGGQTIITGPRVESTRTYDAAGRLTGDKVTGLFDATISPDLNGNSLSIDSSEGANSYRLIYTYDLLDHRESISDVVGQRTRFTLRHDGLATEVFDGRDKKTSLTRSTLGEKLTETRLNQVKFEWKFDKDRQQTFEGEPTGKGNSMEYADKTLRMTRKDLRQAGAFFEYKDPNELNLPRTITIPGGSMSVEYDLQGRVTSQDATYAQGKPYQTEFKYDALDRVREAHYGEGEQHSAEFLYDKLGPMISATYKEALGSFTVGSTIYADGARETCTYPSSAILTETREDNGRLTSISAAGSSVPVPGEIYKVTLFAGAEIPGTVDLGRGVVREANQYDGRKRLLTRRYTSANNTLLADVRYQYDLSDNILLRQQVHRHGRADVFTYDDGNRLVRAETGARPVIPDSVRVNAGGLSGGFGLAAGLYARAYTYDGNGRDLLTGHTPINPDALILPPLPPLAQAISDYDDGYLFAHKVDGFDRGGPDPLGNATHTMLQVRPAGLNEPVPTSSVLTYNGFAQLVKIERADGLTIEYEHQPNGLMHHRKVSQGGTVISDMAMVYDQGRLIEEYEKGGNGTSLRARFYYADDDSPFAADLADSVGNPQRFYYLKDALGSVMAVADQNAQVVERINYHPWGQPEIQGRDTAPPRVAAVIASVNNEMLVLFTESVLPPLQGAGPGRDPVTTASAFDSAFDLSATNGPVLLGKVTYEENLPTGFPFGAVVRLRPQGAFSGPLSLRFHAGATVDEWGNTNAEAQVSLNTAATNGVLFQGPLVGSTAPPRLARSDIGNPFLFHGQFFDYDAGLVYLRARFYDPYTGQFLQRDPQEYQDSVNLYAGFANNPASRRDPAGSSLELIGRWLAEYAVEAGAKATEKTVLSAVTREARAAAIAGAKTVIRNEERALVPVASRMARALRDAPVPVDVYLAKAQREIAHAVAARETVQLARQQLLPQLEAQLNRRGRNLLARGARLRALGTEASGVFEGVEMAEVRVALRGDTLFVLRTGAGTTSTGARGAGRAAVKGLEEAAVELAERRGARRVVFTAENFDNVSWRDWHISEGYRMTDPTQFAVTSGGFHFTPSSEVSPQLFRKVLEVP